MCSGKDTYGRLYQEISPGAVHYSFATPLRKELAYILKLLINKKTLNDVAQEVNTSELNIVMLGDILNWDFSKSPYERTPEMRAALQFWGTTVRRTQDPNYWISIANNDIRKLREKTPVYITDGRFLNELNFLKSIGSIMFKLEIDRETQVERIRNRDGFTPNIETLTHPSETEHLAFKGYDYVINTTSLEECNIKKYLRSKI